MEFQKKKLSRQRQSKVNPNFIPSSVSYPVRQFIFYSFTLTKHSFTASQYLKSSCEKAVVVYSSLTLLSKEYIFILVWDKPTLKPFLDKEKEVHADCIGQMWK
jgi:hypothetical protein